VRQRHGLECILMKPQDVICVLVGDVEVLLTIERDTVYMVGSGIHYG
jgi:hypothetical protein